MKKKILKTSLTALLCLGFIASYYLYFRYQPIINWQPQHHLTVSGEISPALLKSGQLQWQSVYTSNNPHCLYSASFLEGAYAIREHRRTIRLSIDKNGFFSAAIPLDYYLPGYCHWQILLIGFQLNNFNHSKKNNSTPTSIASDRNPTFIASFDKKYDKPQKYNASLSIQCHSEQHCTVIKDQPFYWQMNPQRSYQYKLKILMKKP